jgi:hypothetical protein
VERHIGAKQEKEAKARSKDQKAARGTVATAAAVATTTKATAKAAKEQLDKETLSKVERVTRRVIKEMARHHHRLHTTKARAKTFASVANQDTLQLQAADLQPDRISNDTYYAWHNDQHDQHYNQWQHDWSQGPQQQKPTASIHLSTYPPIHLSIYPSIHLSIYPSIHPCIYLPYC